MDSTQDPGGVQWVPSQSPIPALQALMREAERDRRTRPSTPVHEHTSWTYPLSASASAWHSTARSSSSSSLDNRANIRQPLASSTSSANRPPRHHARPRSSSHSTIPNPSAPNQKYTSQDDEPETDFMQLLKRTTKQVNENSKMKERVVWQKEKEKREHSLPRPVIENRTSAKETNPSARLLAKTSSASAIYPINSSATTLSASTSAQTASGKSTPTSLPSPSLNCDLKHRPPQRQFSDRSSACKPSFSEHTANNGDTTMQEVVDLTETDTEWDRPISGLSSCADTAMCMELDDDDSDTGMDVSFYKPEPPPNIRAAPTLQSNSQLPQPTRRPPPLGMRRAPQPSQYSSTQGPKGITVPRFRPPLLANTGGSMNKHASGAKPPTIASTSKAPPRCSAPRASVAKMVPRNCQDPDSSFDVSLDMDADALEEAMKAYD